MLLLLLLLCLLLWLLLLLLGSIIHLMILWHALACCSWDCNTIFINLPNNVTAVDEIYIYIFTWMCVHYSRHATTTLVPNRFSYQATHHHCQHNRFSYQINLRIKSIFVPNRLSYHYSHHNRHNHSHIHNLMIIIISKIKLIVVIINIRIIISIHRSSNRKFKKNRKFRKSKMLQQWKLEASEKDISKTQAITNSRIWYDEHSEDK